MGLSNPIDSLYCFIGEENMTWDRVKDILTICVIPLLIWGVRLEVSNAIQAERISELKSKVSSSEKTVNKIEEAVQKNSLQLAKLDGKLESLDEKLDDIHDLIKKRNP